MGRKLLGICALVAAAILASCDRGSDSRENAPGGGQPPPPVTASSDPVVLRFGAQNRVEAVAGSVAFSVPIEVATGSVLVDLRLVNGPSFVRVDGQSLAIDPSALANAAVDYDVTVSAVDSGGKELGRQVGAVRVLAVSQSAAPQTLANESGIDVPEVGLRIEAPANAFDAGAVQISVDRVLDANGRASTRLLLSEPHVKALRLLSLGSPTMRAFSASARTTAVRRSVGVDCGEPGGTSGDLLLPSTSVADSCIRGWIQPTVEFTCAGSSGLAQSTQPVPLRTETGTLPAWRLACGGGGQVAVVRDGRVWSKLSGPQDWKTRNWEAARVLPVLLVHGYTKGNGIGGGPVTWGDSFRSRLEAAVRGDARLVVFEFQWATNSYFEDAADELIEAALKVKSITGQSSVIVAHSHGGILARVAAQGLGVSGSRQLDESVERIITIGTAHSGISTERTSELPRGADFLVSDLIAVGCWQIVCLQSGAALFVTGEGSALPGFDYAGDKGEIIFRLADLDAHRLEIPLTVLIGLNRYVGNADSIGDGLISLSGQRFSTKADLSGDKSSLAFKRTAAVSEHLLGAHADTSLDVVKLQAQGPRIVHSRGTDGGLIANEYQAVVDSDSHPTWRAISAVLEIGTTATTPVSVSSVSPTAMVANGTLQTLTINGSSFTSGNVVQFKWGAGSGAGVWNTSSQTPSISSATLITIPMNPGTVSDTINVRVCRSSSATATADCSSGTQSVTVTPAAAAVPTVSSVSPTAMVANGTLQTLTINGSSFTSGNVVQFKWGAGSGSGVWTTSSRTPSITSTRITIPMNPGTVSDTINVRVCRSSSATATADCSSGTRSVTVRP